MTNHLTPTAHYFQTKESINKLIMQRVEQSRKLRMMGEDPEAMEVEPTARMRKCTYLVSEQNRKEIDRLIMQYMQDQGHG